ncbi:MAG TPA: class I SAM-dependent methyltransferase [Thermoleophilaceae bacterium]|nr:class I SAM-dependent methyltransferase [Thermoleophilaceae bacterium]
MTAAGGAPGTAPRGDDWDRHWDAYAAAAEANPAQRYRRRLALRLLGAEESPARLLDLGSGQGDFLRAAAQRWPQAQLLGIEPSEVGVRESQAKVPGASFLALDLISGVDPALPAQFRDWATHAVCSEVLEHVDEPEALLRAAIGAMAPGCRLVVTVPGGRMSAFDRTIGHRRHYTPTSLAQSLREAGLEVEWTSGAGFPFFNLYRALVIARGDKLAGDVAAHGPDGGSSLAARAAMLAFRPLLGLTLTRSRFGVQIVGVARVPGRA